MHRKILSEIHSVLNVFMVYDGSHRHSQCAQTHTKTVNYYRIEIVHLVVVHIARRLSHDFLPATGRSISLSLVARKIVLDQ